MGFRIYKGVSGKFGALVALLAPAKTSKDGKNYPAAIMVDVAKTIDKNKYDWDNKITVKLGMNDVTQILGSTNGEWKLVHQWQNRTTTIQLSAGKEYGWNLNISASTEGSDIKNSVYLPISDGEYEIFMELIRQSLTTMTGWFDNQFSSETRDES